MESQNTRQALGALALFIAIPAAHAESDLSYTWFEVDYANVDIDTVEDGNLIEDFDDGGG